MAVAALAGNRIVQIKERRTKSDWALFLKDVASRCRKAEKITLIIDNLNTRAPGSFYETFPPAEAKALWDRFEFVYTPKRGSWLNIAEIEMNVLIRQCLGRRIDAVDEMQRATRAWEERRNNARACVDWQFTTDDARIKLKRLYPTVGT